MPHTPVRSVRTVPVRLLAPLLIAVLGGAALVYCSAPQPALTHAQAPVWLAGDNDKGGMGGG